MLTLLDLSTVSADQNLTIVTADQIPDKVVLSNVTNGNQSDIEVLGQNCGTVFISPEPGKAGGDHIITGVLVKTESWRALTRH